MLLVKIATFYVLASCLAIRGLIAGLLFVVRLNYTSDGTVSRKKLPIPTGFARGTLLRDRIL